MLRRSAKHIIITLLLALLTTVALAQGSEADNIKQLQTQMYKLYPGTDYDQFIEVTERLKSAALKAGDERTFYRAWGNQALFSANHQRRNRGLQIAKEQQEYAISHNSRFGIYNGTHSRPTCLLRWGRRRRPRRSSGWLSTICTNICPARVQPAVFWNCRSWPTTITIHIKSYTTHSRPCASPTSTLCTA